MTLASSLSAQTYTYDPNGRLASVAHPGGQVLTYQYDAEGNISGTMQDSEGDGMSDEFEDVIINANPTDAFETYADVLPNQDFDQDGDSNIAEFIAGTFPADGKVIPATSTIGIIALIAGLVAMAFHQRKRFQTT